MPRFHVQRSIQIDSPPEKVFDAVADFSTWTTWSPWLCAEPDAEVDVSEDPSSVGSIYSWKGELVGQGEIEHRRLERGRLIEDEIRFLEPMRSQSEVAFEMEPVGDETRLTWQMRGSLPWFLFWMRSQMELFIGMDYDRGLKMLKEWIETGEILSKTKMHGVESVGPLSMAGVRKTCAVQDVGPSMKDAFAEASRKLTEHQLPTEGQPISVYHEFNMKAGTFDYTSGYVLPESTEAIPPGLSHWSIPRTDALHVEHIGSYDHLGNAWSAANQMIRYKRLKQSKCGAYEIYRNMSQETPPADLRTDIYLPLR